MRLVSTASVVLTLFLVTVPLVTGAPVAAERRVVSPPGEDLGLPFSPAVWAGERLYLSGALGNPPGTMRVDGDTREQTLQALANLERILAAAGLDRSRVVAAELYVADARFIADASAVLAEHFAESSVPPAVTTVEADLALPNARVELALVAAAREVAIERIVPEGWPVTPGRDAGGGSWAVRAGDVLFLAGLSARDAISGRSISGDLAAQTEQTMAHVDTVLAAAGLDAGQLARCRVFLPDPRDYGAMNEAYGAYFAAHEITAPPSRATVRARLPQPDAKIGVQCVAAAGERSVVRAEGTPPSPRPFSPAIRAGDQVFLAGMVGRGADGFPPDLAEQTRITLKNLEATLAAAGLGFDDVVNAVVYLSDTRHFAAMNEVYREVVGTPAPARATVGTPLMTPDAWVEIQMTAVVPSPAPDVEE